MNIIKVEKNKIEAISDYVSSIVHSYADDYMFEGAYITSKVNKDQELSSIALHLVYIDYRFRKWYSKDDLEKVCLETGVNISIKNDPYWQIGHNISGNALLNGHIIFDRQGNLTETQRLFRLEHSNEVAPIITDPPIQYKKTV